MAYLTEIRIENQRTMSKDRLLSFNHNHKNKFLNYIQGIWNDQYSLNFTDLNCILIEGES